MGLRNENGWPGMIFGLSLMVGLCLGGSRADYATVASDSSSSLPAGPDPLKAIAADTEIVTPTGYSIVDDLTHCNPQYAFIHEAHQKWLLAAVDMLALRKARHLDTACAQQLWQEIFWMNRSTTWYHAVLNREYLFTKALLDSDTPKSKRRSDLFQNCSKSTVLQLSSDYDEIASAYDAKLPLKVIPRYLETVNSPAALRGFMLKLRVSDVYNECIDHRDELNEWTADLTRIIYRDMVHSKLESDKLDAALLSFIEDDWQSPATGFWGAWYAHNGKIIKTDDLSITFHIVSYYPETRPVRYWPQIIATTLALKGKRYPYGWDGPKHAQCPHHLYDVVRLLHRGWSHVGEDQRKQMRAEIKEIWDWATSGEDHRATDVLCDPDHVETELFTQKLNAELTETDGGEAFFWR